MKEETAELKIYFKNEQSKEPLTPILRKLVRRAVTEALSEEEFYGKSEVSITFTDDNGIRCLNREYRNIDSSTDVLSFPLNDFENDEFAEDETVELGDIVISLETARRQSEMYGHSFDREVAFLCVHSTLHLLGYDHETGENDENDMRRRQRIIMERLGLAVGGEVK